MIVILNHVWAANAIPLGFILFHNELLCRAPGPHWRRMLRRPPPNNCQRVARHALLIIDHSECRRA
jgi:hypothetical protein